MNQVTCSLNSIQITTMYRRKLQRKGILESDPFRKHRRKIGSGLQLVKCKIWTDSRKITQMHPNVWKSYTHLLI